MTVESDLRRILDEISGLKGSISPHDHSEPWGERREPRHSFGGRYSHPESEVHTVADHDKECKTCGEKSPFFKDEVFCNPEAGGCGRDLGSISHAITLPGCPSCHKTDTAKPKGRHVICDPATGGCGRPIAGSLEEFHEKNYAECPFGCGGTGATWSKGEED